MKLFETLKRIKQDKVIAVIRADNFEQAVDYSESCIRGGFKSIELTYTTPNASQAIAKLKEKQPHILIGAGTVLEPTTAKLAMESGAEFIVSPDFNKEIAKLCNVYQIPYLPGCMTVTEMTTALAYGCSVIKLFPSSQFGPSAIKQFQGPLPQVSIVPTGGVNLENIQDWMDQGAFAVGIGGSLTKGTLEEIEKKAHSFVKQVG